MADFDLTSAIALIGKFVLVETVLGENHAPDWYCAQILGVVPPLDGVSTHPYFMVLDIPYASELPEELFWEDIRSLQILEIAPPQGART
jgi:hypothetical protein